MINFQNWNDNLIILDAKMSFSDDSEFLKIIMEDPEKMKNQFKAIFVTKLNFETQYLKYICPKFM